MLKLNSYSHDADQWQDVWVAPADIIAIEEREGRLGMVHLKYVLVTMRGGRQFRIRDCERKMGETLSKAKDAACQESQQTMGVDPRQTFTK